MVCMYADESLKENKQAARWCNVPLFSFYPVVRCVTAKSDHQVEAVCTVVNAYFIRQCSK